MIRAGVKARNQRVVRPKSWSKELSQSTILDDRLTRVLYPSGALNENEARAMNKRRAVGVLLIGLLFFLCGAIGARMFYRFPMGLFDVTFWEDVLIFSAVAVLGLALTVYAAFCLGRAK